MPMIRTGPVIRRGDRKDSLGRPLRKRQLALLWKLRRLMATSGNNHGVLARVLPDGTRIIARITTRGAGWLYLIEGVAPPRGTAPILELGWLMESGLCTAVGSGSTFITEIYYTTELIADHDALNPPAEPLSWLDWFDVKTVTSTQRVYVEAMPSLAMDSETRFNQFTVGLNFGARSGKTLLLEQALSGTRNDIPVKDYNGETTP